jgi:Cys-rich protein (TIGR01571 family)
LKNCINPHIILFYPSLIEQLINMSNHFKQSLFGCFNDFSSCICILCLPGGLYCFQSQAVSMSTGGSQSLPYWIAYNCGVLGAAMNRGTIRKSLGIQGNYCSDCCIWCICPLCAACQEYREALGSKRELAKAVSAVHSNFNSN